MRTITLKTGLLGWLLCLTAISLPVTAASFTASFDLDKADMSSTGRNQYFVLEPGCQLVLEGADQGKATVLTVTVRAPRSTNSTRPRRIDHGRQLETD